MCCEKVGLNKLEWWSFCGPSPSLNLVNTFPNHTYILVRNMAAIFACLVVWIKIFELTFFQLLVRLWTKSDFCKRIWIYGRLVCFSGKTLLCSLKIRSVFRFLVTAALLVERALMLQNSIPPSRHCWVKTCAWSHACSRASIDTWLSARSRHLVGGKSNPQMSSDRYCFLYLQVPVALVSFIFSAHWDRRTKIIFA